MKQVCDYDAYQHIVSQYNRKGVHTNNYLQNDASDLIIHNALFVECYSSNAFFFVKREKGMRIYYYINDLNEEADFSSYTDLVIEILFRGEVPQTEADYFTKLGFKENLVRDEYRGIYKNLRTIEKPQGIEIGPASSLVTVQRACNLFNDTFDSLSGNYIPDSQQLALLHFGNIIIAMDDSKRFLGALHQDKKGKVNVIEHIAVERYARGMKVGPALVSAFIKGNRECDDTRYMLWVQRNNAVAVKMYTSMGFIPTTKSTLSLIK